MWVHVQLLHCIVPAQEVFWCKRFYPTVRRLCSLLDRLPFDPGVSHIRCPKSTTPQCTMKPELSFIIFVCFLKNYNFIFLVSLHQCNFKHFGPYSIWFLLPPWGLSNNASTWKNRPYPALTRCIMMGPVGLGSCSRALHQVSYLTWLSATCNSQYTNTKASQCRPAYLPPPHLPFLHLIFSVLMGLRSTSSAH